MTFSDPGSINPSSASPSSQGPASSRSRGAMEMSQPGSWVGWVVFAGIMMILVGLYQCFMGLVAIFNDKMFLVPEKGLLITVDYTVWGWVHLLLGLVLILAGFGAMTGRTWARVVGIIAALVSAVVQMGFISAQPFWALTIIVIDILVIFALAVHGAEAKNL